MAFLNSVAARLLAKGHKVEDALIHTHSARVESVIEKTKQADFDLAKVSGADRRIVTSSVNALMDDLRKSGMNELKAKSLVLEAFRPSLGEAYGTGADAATKQKNFEILLGNAFSERDVAQTAAREAKRASDTVPPTGAGGKPSGGGEPPRSGPESNTTEAEKAARAGKEAQFARDDLISTYTARNEVAKGIETISQGGLAEKKEAFDKIDKNIRSTGLIKGLQTPQEIEEAARNAGRDDRSVDVIKGILGQRPAQVTQEGAPPQFLTGLISNSEWLKLRSSLHADLLQTEQRLITDNLDVVRTSLTTKLSIKETKDTFMRLRAISDDTDYQAAAPTQGKSPKINTPKETQAALLAGERVSRDDLNRLETYYTRYHTEQPATASDAGLISKAISVITGGKFGGKGGTAGAKEPSSFDRMAEWETGKRIVKPIGTALKVAGTATAGATIAAALGTGATVFVNPEIEDGPVRSVGVTALSTLGGLGLPGGTSGNMYSEAIAIKAQRDPQVIKRLEKRLSSDGVAPPAVNDAIAFLKENTAKRKTADTADDAATKANLDQQAATGQRQGFQAIAQTAPVATDHQVRQVLGNALESGDITPMEMRALATKMHEKSTSDGQAGFSAKDFAALQAEPEFKNLKEPAQQRIIDDLTPRIR